MGAVVFGMRANLIACLVRYTGVDVCHLDRLTLAQLRRIADALSMTRAGSPA
jgi:hypothetical protein